MSSLANVIELPVRQEFEERDSLEHDMVLALATADDLASGMDAVVGRIRRDSRAARAEWWAKDEAGALELVAVDGIARGGCHSLPLGPAGVFVLHGGRLDRQVESALVSLAPIIRRRAAEERLARTTLQLARCNEALEDFAALVAHELDQLIRVARLAGDLEVGSLEQAREPFAQQDVVVGHDDATAGGRLRSHDRLNLTPLPGSGYGKIPAVRMQRGALVGYRREAR